MEQHIAIDLRPTSDSPIYTPINSLPKIVLYRCVQGGSGVAIDFVLGLPVAWEI
jgi:hypothetical protein